MRVGEVARRTGLSVRMLRSYEERSYLPPQARTPGRHRVSDEADVRWLQALTTLRAAGVGPGSPPALSAARSPGSSWSGSSSG